MPLILQAANGLNTAVWFSGLSLNDYATTIKELASYREIIDSSGVAPLTPVRFAVNSWVSSTNFDLIPPTVHLTH